MKGQFNAVLPRGVSAEKFLRVLQTAATASPELVSADRNSLFAAAMSAAQDGLLPDGKEAAIVAYGNKATYMPMIGGLNKMIYRSGLVNSISSAVVRKNDAFEYRITEEGERLTHVPDMFKDRGERVGVYAIARLSNGGYICELISSEEIKALKLEKAKSKASPWNGAHEEEMWRKTAVKRLAKRLPIRTTIEDDYEGDRINVVGNNNTVIGQATEEENEIEAPAS